MAATGNYRAAGQALLPARSASREFRNGGGLTCRCRAAPATTYVSSIFILGGVPSRGGCLLLGGAISMYDMRLRCEEKRGEEISSLPSANIGRLGRGCIETGPASLMTGNNRYWQLDVLVLARV